MNSARGDAVGSATVDQLLTVDDAERRAEEVVAPDAWSYIAGGAGDERTLRWNREAFSKFRLRPRVLVDVSSVSTETTVLGTPVSMPVLVAPMAFHQIAHEEGEVATGCGTAAAGTTCASRPLRRPLPPRLPLRRRTVRAGFRSTCSAIER